MYLSKKIKFDFSLVSCHAILDCQETFPSILCSVMHKLSKQEANTVLLDQRVEDNALLINLKTQKSVSKCQRQGLPLAQVVQMQPKAISALDPQL